MKPTKHLHPVMRSFRHRALRRGTLRQRTPWWREVIADAMRVNLDAQAAAVAFNAVFAVGPLVSLALTFLNAVGGATFDATLRRLLLSYAPPATWGFFESLSWSLRSRSNPLVAVIAVLALCWTSSSAASAIINVIITVRNAEPRGFVRTRLRAIGLGAVSALALGALTVTVSLGPNMARFLHRMTGMSLPTLLGLSSLWVRVPFAGITFSAMAALFFRYGTPLRIAWRPTIAGSLASGALISLATALLSLYLTEAPKLGGGYGTSTAFFGVLLWLYLIGVSVVLGACITRVTERRWHLPPHAPYLLGGDDR